jgi:uncharacterized protein YecE (DUF72 family)
VSRDDRSRRQLDLFAPAAHDLSDAPATGSRQRQPPPGPAEVTDAVASVARQLPADIRLGTSSWSFPGWAGIVYDRAAAPHELARYGLAAYARHPLLRTVGVDRTYYAPIAADDFAAYARAVPDGFRFLVKAHEQCSWLRFPRLARYGSTQGQLNALFLDAAYARDAVVAPLVTGLGNKAGPLVFQFPPQHFDSLGGPSGFALRLRQFLAALPRGPLYAVEIRNARLLTPAYADALASAGVCHCVSVHPTMPDVDTQLAVAASAAAPATVIRWMLGGQQAYEDARDRYQPFDRIVDPDPRSRDAIARACIATARAGRPAFVIINNKAEGSAPLSVARLAARIVEVA